MSTEMRCMRPDRGVVLGVSLMLVLLLIGTAAFALWMVSGETDAARQHRLARQLLDCAERGLAFGKQYFSTTARPQWNSYLAASGCTTLPCPPFPAGAPGPAISGYPDAAPFSGTVTMGGIALQSVVAVYNNPENPPSPFADHDNRIIVYARCRDPISQQERAVQALIVVPQIVTTDYVGQAGRGFRNQGNANF